MRQIITGALGFVLGVLIMTPDSLHNKGILIALSVLTMVLLGMMFIPDDIMKIFKRKK